MNSPAQPITATDAVVPPAPLPGSPQPAALARQGRRLATLGTAPWLHDEVARRLSGKLDAILLQPEHWLDASGTLGGRSEAVSLRFAQAKRWVCEPTPALADAAEAHWLAAHAQPWWAAWRKPPPAPVVRSLGHWPAHWPQGGVGMLWANMAWHAAPDIDALLRQWHGALHPDGFLMCSGLGPDTATELHALYKSMGWGLPGMRFVDMHDLGDALVRAGFADPVMDMERLTLTWPDAETMLAELQTWGGNVAWGRFQGCRTPRWRARLLAAMAEQLAGPDGRLALTIELVYGHAIRPWPRATVQPETRVSLDEMRRMTRRPPQA